MTIANLKNIWAKKFLKSGSSTPELDVDCILQFMFNQDKTWLLLHRKDELSIEEEKQFIKLAEQRLTGLPIAYITNKKEFYGTDFYVTPEVLIPKPDTEILVENALKMIYNKKKSELKILDVCTGSGCVGLSVLKNILSCQEKIKVKMTLADISLQALSIAKKNAEIIFKDKPFVLNQISFLNGNLLCGTCGYDFILANPPYIPHNQVEELLLDGRREPRLALDGDFDTACDFKFPPSEYCDELFDGLKIILRLVPEAFEALNLDGVFIMESGEYQTKRVRKIFAESGFKNIHSEKDFSGMERITIGEKK